ncbi:MAG TPA: efflux RND transporter periplasmic adaptor subunit [Gemmataceae bacterium]|jgi:multidrug efflux pump subunit AcrA (membrane-fusion protein)|nr:efflux RND transporter periplasmic adaptor subunit [Gemmataceae bacterium]
MIRRILILSVLLVAGCGAGVVAYIKVSHKPEPTAEARPSGESKTVVRTVRPKLDTSFRVSNQQIATVEPFYQAHLRARAAGVVRVVRREIGEAVRLGEPLVEIEAPDLAADVDQKEAVIAQRQQELLVSRAMLKNVEAAQDSAAAAVAQRTAEAKQALATRNYRYSLFTRVSGLQTDKFVTDKVVEESRQDYLAAEGALEAAQAAVARAKADQVEKRATLEAARADTELKAALIEVARKDRDRAAAAAAFARITAPFDGVVTRRNVDPGAFVQNATTGSGEALMTVARVDLLTVAMKLPDVAAPYISRDTDVEVTFDDLPGLTVHGKVSRFAPSIDGSDRTMRVEVDIFNGTDAEFQKLLARAVAETLAPLGTPAGFGAAAAALSIEANRPLYHKGVSDGIAVCPECLSPGGRGARPLVPGMTASMRVFLDGVSHAYLLPASAVYVQGGKAYILVVENGVTKQVPVRRQVSDGRIAKVAVLTPAGEAGPAHDLTGTEEVVVSRQAEIGDGARVRTAVGDW